MFLSSELRLHGDVRVIFGQHVVAGLLNACYTMSHFYGTLSVMAQHLPVVILVEITTQALLVKSLLTFRRELGIAKGYSLIY